MYVLIDFETASACDLKKAGAWRYAEDPTTEVICLGFSTNGGPPLVWPPGDFNFDSTPTARQFRAALRPGTMFIAHNAAFEKAIWRNIMVRQLNWPDIPNAQFHDTQAVCAMKALPLKLERAASALRLAIQKDTEGTKATHALGRLIRTGYYSPRTPEKLQRVYDYCKQDVAAELELHRRVKGLGPDERRVWLLDQTINERGVRLDLDFVAAAQEICDQAARPLLAEFAELTGGLKPTQRDQYMTWLVNAGAKLPDLKKETISRLLGEHDDEEDSLAETEDDYEEDQTRIELPPLCRRSLEIRKILGSASVKKLAAMQSCVCADGRARGLLQYHGAGPGRWAGRLLQPQNFPRPTLEIDGKGHNPEELVAAIATRDAEFVRCLYGEPIEAVASGLRHALIADPGKLFEVGDFSTVEARIVLALAGAQKALSVISDPNRDVYAEMAGTIFNMAAPVGKAEVKAWKELHPKERHTGKNTVLGCGFQMGWRKFKDRYAKDEGDEFAQRCITAYREDFAPEVPKLWYALEQAAVRTVWDRTTHEAYGIVYALEDGFLTARLPSGRKLWYYDPRPVKKAMPWDKDDIRPGFEYSAWKMGQWKRIAAYGGLLTENVVQATARDLLVNAMFNCGAAGHPLVLTVHDEVITEVPEQVADAKLLDRMMTDVPQWARNLRIPVAAECWIGERYRK